MRYRQTRMIQGTAIRAGADEYTVAEEFSGQEGSGATFLSSTLPSAYNRPVMPWRFSPEREGVSLPTRIAGGTTL
jgi:hypothetical protein